ncbi:hypothetical protein CA834_07190 [Winogradskyella aurantia]|uniref:Oligosaccharide repeat unit polymerase n=2 Tax=Winogradskyella aurantia TaxID=1915063 RepID=A0A265UV90_9FLAO|nr:hypothetical protein CA834_07190 [Winogradskyella aurantia]
MFSFQVLQICSALFIGIGVWYYLRKNDEIPLILALFYYTVAILRFSLIQEGVLDYVVVNYTFDIFNLNDESANVAMNYMFLGTAVLTFFYMRFASRYQRKEKDPVDNDQNLSEFITKKMPYITAGFFVFLVVNAALAGSGSGALGQGYLNLLKFGLGGFNLLMALILISARLKSNQRLPVIIFLIIGILSSYAPSSRFVFLSWAIGISFLVFKDMRPLRKLRYILPGALGIVLFFSLLGVARETNLSAISWEEKLALATERALITEDQNMLDGFMMVLDVYPQFLDFSWGTEHVEILLRPIPRAWWPEKPLGGYANKLGLNDAEEETVGISQSIYGSFYGEGGVTGIILFSIVYAKLLAWLLYLAKSYRSNLRFLIKGVIVASLIPLLRGGDLPGIYAFIGMSFWPVFLFIYSYHKHLKRSYVIA